MTLHTRLTTLRAAALLSTCLLAAPAVLAQPMPAADGPGVERPDGRDEGPGGPSGPRPFGEYGPPPFLGGLDLSEAQRDQVFGILHAQAPKRRELRKAEHKAREALRELSRAPALDGAKAAASAQALGQAIAGQELLRLDTGARLKAVLTPAQRAQLDQRRADDGGKRREGRADRRQGGQAREAGK